LPYTPRAPTPNFAGTQDHIEGTAKTRTHSLRVAMHRCHCRQTTTSPSTRATPPAADTAASSSMVVVLLAIMATSVQAAEKPNILVMLADDLGECCHPLTHTHVLSHKHASCDPMSHMIPHTMLQRRPLCRASDHSCQLEETGQPESNQSDKSLMCLIVQYVRTCMSSGVFRCVCVCVCVRVRV
jgi:hypothetical protein